MKRGINEKKFVAIAVTVGIMLSCMIGCSKNDPVTDAIANDLVVVDEYFHAVDSFDVYVIWNSVFGIAYEDDSDGHSIPRVVVDSAEKRALIQDVLDAYSKENPEKFVPSAAEFEVALTQGLVRVIVDGMTGAPDNSVFEVFDWAGKSAILVKMDTGEQGERGVTNLEYIAKRDVSSAPWNKLAYSWETDRIETYKSTHDVNW